MLTTSRIQTVMNLITPWRGEAVDTKHGGRESCTDRISGGSRNLRTGEGVARSRRGIIFLGLKIVLMPLHTYLMFFVVRVENKLNIVNIAC